MGRPKKDAIKEKNTKVNNNDSNELKTDEEDTIEKFESSSDIQVLSQPSKSDEEEFKKLLKAVEKTFGEGVIVSAEEILDVAKVSTRNFLLDVLTAGGLPKGSIILFFGEESAGKTLQTLILSSVFTSQKIPVLYVASEGDIDKNWALKLGNDLKYFYIARPGDLETAINLVDVAVRSKKFGLVIYDSVTAGVPKESLDKDAFAQQMAAQARLNTKLCQKVTSGLQPSNLKDPNAYNNTMVIFIAHVREKVGIVYGNPVTIPGGHALKHHSSYIITFKKGDIIKIKEQPVGRGLKITIAKSKFSKPLVSGVIDVYFEPIRLNNAKVMITYGIQLGIIKQSGSFYSYKDITAQGKLAFLNEVKKSKHFLTEIKTQIIESFNK